ncbi:unnamed protein product [Arctia plantaginis]|uniref:Uncharacterized protein n=1 Tax=Arctia plantaginis TaxID=874455 RepID=A0A8S1ALF9_ARCPL|nr:unnamed protein product [Arctia plantaginis]
MKGRSIRAPSKLPVVLGKVLLRWIFTKADLVFFVYRFVWYACHHIHVQSSMNSSVDFFESLIDEDGRFAELNSQEPQWGYRSRPRPLPQGMI